jgi:hypothetical protein
MSKFVTFNSPFVLWMGRAPFQGVISKLVTFSELILNYNTLEGLIYDFLFICLRCF